MRPRIVRRSARSPREQAARILARMRTRRQLRGSRSFAVRAPPETVAHKSASGGIAVAHHGVRDGARRQHRGGRRTRGSWSDVFKARASPLPREHSPYHKDRDFVFEPCADAEQDNGVDRNVSERNGYGRSSSVWYFGARAVDFAMKAASASPWSGGGASVRDPTRAATATKNSS